MTRADSTGRMRGRKAKWPFEQLKVGQYFFLRGMRRNITGPYIKFWRDMLHGRDFTSKTVEGGVEVWRVK